MGIHLRAKQGKDKWLLVGYCQSQINKYIYIYIYFTFLFFIKRQTKNAF